MEPIPCYDLQIMVGRDSVEPPAHEMGRNPPAYNARKSASFSDLLTLGLNGSTESRPTWGTRLLISLIPTSNSQSEQMRECG
jgi:hypothetical protein